MIICLNYLRGFTIFTILFNIQFDSASSNDIERFENKYEIETINNYVFSEKKETFRIQLMIDFILEKISSRYIRDKKIEVGI